jgi:uncharacterized protein (DUF305 family)
MQTHHAQAVEMALIVRDKTTDPTIRTIAYDIATTQQQQIGQMYAWLHQWNLPQTSTEAPMSWMTGTTGHSGMTGHSPTPTDKAATGDTATGSMPTGTMPGMATPQDLDRLRNLTGKQAEALFLRLMIAHHQGGVTMAQAALDTATTSTVRTLASSIVTSQMAEIALMKGLLDERVQP